MILGEVCCGFFQELIFHPEFPRFPLEFTEPGPLTHIQRRFLAGMVTPIGANPVTKSPRIETEFPGHQSYRTRSLDHRLHGLLPKLRSEILLRTRQNLSFPEGPILVGALSGRFVAPQRPRWGMLCGWRMCPIRRSRSGPGVGRIRRSTRPRFWPSTTPPIVMAGVR